MHASKATPNQRHIINTKLRSLIKDNRRLFRHQKQFVLAQYRRNKDSFLSHITWQTTQAKAEADKRYSQSASGKTSHDKARTQWKEKFEAENGISFSTWRIQNDPQYRLHSRLNTRISDVLKKQGMVKSARTAELIDAEIADLKAYLLANW